MEPASWERKIIRNAARCAKCGDVIESKTRHDFVMCSCRSIFVDGGHDYVRCGGNLEYLEILTEYEPAADSGSAPVLEARLQP